MGDMPTATVISPDGRISLDFMSKSQSFEQARSWLVSYLDTVLVKKQPTTEQQGRSRPSRTSTRRPQPQS
jgi:hypothetical protein